MRANQTISGVVRKNVGHKSSLQISSTSEIVYKRDKLKNYCSVSPKDTHHTTHSEENGERNETNISTKEIRAQNIQNYLLKNKITKFLFRLPNFKQSISPKYDAVEKVENYISANFSPIAGN